MDINATAEMLLTEHEFCSKSLTMVRDRTQWIVTFEDGTEDCWTLSDSEMLAQPIDSYEPFAETTVLDEDILIGFWDNITKRRNSP